MDATLEKYTREIMARPPAPEKPRSKKETSEVQIPKYPLNEKRDPTLSPQEAEEALIAEKQRLESLAEQQQCERIKPAGQGKYTS